MRPIKLVKCDTLFKANFRALKNGDCDGIDKHEDQISYHNVSHD